MATDQGWSWEATGTIVALIGVAVTFVFSYLGERRQRRLAEDEARRTDAAAERSERAAALSIDTMERIAEAIEAVAAKDFSSPTLIPGGPPARVRWSLTHFQGDRYMLQNTGTATAYRVQVRADESLVMNGQIPGEGDLRPDDSVTFMAIVTFGTRDTTITVEWFDSEEPDADREVWRYPLPPRPPRS